MALLRSITVHTDLSGYIVHVHDLCIEGKSTI